jgi:hypothetical protein
LQEDEDDSIPELMSPARNQTGLFISLKIALETILARGALLF